MDKLSDALIDKLIEKTFEDMTTEEKLNFIERIFAGLDPEGKERFLRRMVQALSPDGMSEGEPGAAWRRFSMMAQATEMSPLHEFGPWRRCCRMMMGVSQTPQLDSAQATDATRVFEALANETRLKIIKLLAEGEKCVDDLIPVLGLAQSSVSHHLRVLKEAGLLCSEKRGRCVYYSITPPERR